MAQEGKEGAGMLVLTVKIGGGVVLILPDGREVRVSLGTHQPTLHSGKVRLAVEADRDIIVLREELIGRSGTSPGGGKVAE